MSRIGIICDLSYTRHHLFHSYYYAISRLYDQYPTVVTCKENLSNIDILFIGDDHYAPHKEIWQAPGFIETCNHKGIEVVVFTNEKILDSFFPWNKEIYIKLQQFRFLHHYAIDVEDCEKLGIKLNRTAPAMYFAPKMPEVEKKDKAVFIGNVKCKSYKERVGVLKEVEKLIDIDIYSDIPTWNEYLKIIAGYRFVFSPIGNGNFFPMRFYEALAVHSIPIHQVRENTLKYYDIEAKYNDCIFFQHPSELKDKIQACTLQRSTNVLWMDDNMELLLSKDKLLDYGKE